MHNVLWPRLIITNESFHSISSLKDTLMVGDLFEKIKNKKNKQFIINTDFNSLMLPLCPQGKNVVHQLIALAYHYPVILKLSSFFFLHSVKHLILLCQ